MDRAQTKWGEKKGGGGCRRALACRPTHTHPASGDTLALGGGAARDPKRYGFVLCAMLDQSQSGCTGNDPSAGSPTETLLRLLLPLDSQV